MSEKLVIRIITRQGLGDSQNLKDARGVWGLWMLRILMGCGDFGIYVL